MFEFTGPVTIHLHCGVTAAEIRQIMKEELMTEAEAIAALDAKVTDLIADVRAALAILQGERDELGPEGQAALDALTAKIDAFDTEVGDADGSDTPPPPPPGV